MKKLFRQIKDLIFCKVGWHDWNTDWQCEHCKSWRSLEDREDHEQRVEGVGDWEGRTRGNWGGL